MAKRDFSLWKIRAINAECVARHMSLAGVETIPEKGQSSSLQFHSSLSTFTYPLHFLSYYFSANNRRGSRIMQWQGRLVGQGKGGCGGAWLNERALAFCLRYLQAHKLLNGMVCRFFYFKGKEKESFFFPNYFHIWMKRWEKIKKFKLGFREVDEAFIKA